MKIAERPTCQASNRREAVGSCQEYLETPIMSSGRWSRLPLLPPRLSPPLDALLMSCYCSPLTPVSLFITPCTALLRFIHFIFFLCGRFSYFIFYFYFNSMAGSYAALVSPFCLFVPRRATRNEGLSLYIDF